MRACSLKIPCTALTRVLATKIHAEKRTKAGIQKSVSVKQSMELKHCEDFILVAANRGMPWNDQTSVSASLSCSVRIFSQHNLLAN